MTISEFPGIILASASPRRKELLRQIGIEPAVFPADADENVGENDPAKLVELLSERKARAVLDRIKAGGDLPEDVRSILSSGKPCVILGSDTVVALDGRILGKPKSHGEAAEMIRMLSGREHHVCTGVTLLKLAPPGDVAADTFSVCTAVHVSCMDEDEIIAYAESAEPMDKAGAYGIQGSFGRHIDRIDGDYNTVVGVPAAAVYNHIRRLFGCRN